MLEGFGRRFRTAGFSGAGVDTLAEAAGLTSGAFYVHFRSKNEAFRATLIAGLQALREGVLALQRAQGAAWWPAFVQFYLGEKRVCELAEGCALASLMGDVSRMDAALRQEFEAGMDQVVDAILSGPPSPAAPRDRPTALAALATLAGSVTLARSLADPASAAAVAEASTRLLLGQVELPTGAT